MNTGAIKSKVGRCAFVGKFSVAVLMLGFIPQQLLAASNASFTQYIDNVCHSSIASTWNAVAVDQMCQGANMGAFATGPGGFVNVSGNLGTSNAGGGISTRKKKTRIPLDEHIEKTDKGASADGGGWGLLLTPQTSKSNRTETDLENGYQSSLTGLNVGLDYRFSDNFVLGGMIGQTRDKATFLNNAGSLKTSNNTFTLYGTWLPSAQVSVDGYLGYGKINFEGQRYVSIGSIAGMTNGSTTGNQRMAGLSTSYQMDTGRFNIAPFFNLDYIKSSFNGYNETGETVMALGIDSLGNPGLINIGSSRLALHYFDRSTISFTSSLGARVGTSYGYAWGTLVPSVRLAAVHEFQNNAQRLKNELIATPGYGMSVATDAPDRNYLNLGLGLSAALNGGTQLFLDYDKRTQDKLLSSWAVSLGALMEF